MRRTPYYFALTGLEFARYFVLVQATGYFVAATPSASQALRIAAAPNTLFVIAFMFLGIDSKRYDVYKPLLVVGKLAALFSGIIALPGLLGTAAASSPVATYSIFGIVVWDAVSAVLLALPDKARQDQPVPPSPEPERVELD
jgi:hypothetical protein